MEKKLTKRRLEEILKAEFKDATIELEKPGHGRISGFLIWTGFQGVEQIERQERLWGFLEKTLDADELLQISAILTLTPDEEPVQESKRSRHAG
jgi:hypothetical protein